MKVTLIGLEIPYLAGLDEVVGDINYNDCAETLPEFAGRVCYNSVASYGANPLYLRGLINKNHVSVIEHSSASFLIAGISRVCLAQITRHRLFSYSVESQRFVELEGAEYVLPPSIANNHTAQLVFEAEMARTFNTYNALRKLGIPKEDARFALPEATETRLVMTGNFRSWRHFIEMRCDKAAQWEIRAVALAILVELYEVAPNIFDDLWNKYVQ